MTFPKLLLLLCVALSACAPVQPHKPDPPRPHPQPQPHPDPQPGPPNRTHLIATYMGGGCSGLGRLPDFEAWMGRDVDLVVDFLATQSWSAMTSTASWLAGCWARRKVPLVVSVPMLPQDGKSTLALGVRGDYDEQYAAIAKVLVQRGYGNAIIRPGWEFNGGWFPWSARGKGPDYAGTWRHMVSAMRAVPGTEFRFDWCPLVGVGAPSPVDAYPGDEYVDIIGGDVYNTNYFPAGTTDEQRWRANRTAPFGLEWHAKFAAQHKKPMSYPEWGTGTRPDGHGGGDDEVFMTGMTQWIKSNNVLYHGYWDYQAKDYDAKLSSGRLPKAAAVFLRAFGAQR